MPRLMLSATSILTGWESVISSTPRIMPGTELLSCFLFSWLCCCRNTYMENGMNFIFIAWLSFAHEQLLILIHRYQKCYDQKGYIVQKFFAGLWWRGLCLDCLPYWMVFLRDEAFLMSIMGVYWHNLEFFSVIFILLRNFWQQINRGLDFSLYFCGGLP